MLLRTSITIASIIALTSTAYASDVKIKLNGKLDVQAGFSKHSDNTASNTSILSKNSALSTTANIVADDNNTLDSGFVYGARINLHTSTRNNRSTSSHLYITSSAGKFEFGSDKSAYTKMRITSFSNAAATGGGIDPWLKNNTNIGYSATWSNYLDGKIRPSGNLNNAEFARKITYYTPTFYNFQFGISYIPDTQNRGFRAFNDTTHADANASPLYFKNGVATGVTYNYKFNDDLTAKAAVVYEKGKTVQLKNDLSKRSNLKTYTVGTEIAYKNFSIAAAFSDYMKSATLASEAYRNTKTYGVTGRYNHPSKISTSLGYYTSTAQGNKYSSVTLATEYKIMPGFMPYAEITFYQTKGKYNSTVGKKDYGNLTKSTDKHKGSLALVGARLEF